MISFIIADCEFKRIFRPCSKSLAINSTLNWLVDNSLLLSHPFLYMLNEE